MSPEEALKRYEAERPRFRRAALQVKHYLETLAKERHIYASVTAREKDIDSFRAKIAEKGYADCWSDVTDKAGARVVVFSPADVDSFVGAIGDCAGLQVVQIEDKRDVVNPETLAYSGVHVQVVAPPEEGDSEPIECEAQIRTAAQDAWSVVSHRLLYKPVLELPRDAQHAVYRLVALMEIFDQEVQRVSEILPTLPGYEYRDLIQTAETEFLGIAHSKSHRALTAQVLDLLEDVIPADRAYIETLRDFIANSHDLIADALRTYGPRTTFSSDFSYTLFSQAEFLIVLERLGAKPLALENAWKQSGLPMIWLKTAANYSEADIRD